jgi:squalene-associated FAD-dependent desaturase
VAADTARLRLTVVGAGWAGLAAAVRAAQAGHQVILREMAPLAGGRARAFRSDGLMLDNGQHILIGAYHRTLDLMRSVGADPEALLLRSPLTLRFADGRGLRLPPGPAWLAFCRGVLDCQGWTWRDKLDLLRFATRWAASGFSCPPGWTVQRLCTGMRPAVRELLIQPLCVAALNTPAETASASVLLRVMQDALFGPAGSADLLLPRAPLDALLPTPASTWLQAAGVHLALGSRVMQLTSRGTDWLVDGQVQDAVILACTAAEAARLAQDHAPDWARQARALHYAPIVTVYLRCPGARLPAAMTALIEGPQAPAQHAFDHGALGLEPGLFAFVISGAGRWIEGGLARTVELVVAQARQTLKAVSTPAQPQVLQVLTEKRATFSCTPGLDRPASSIAPGLLAAGDYVSGPYPATLEGAVRSGEEAVRRLG